MGGDGGYTAFDVENPATWYAETQWIANSGYSGPRKNGVQAIRGIDTSERGLFIAPLVMDPVDSKRLYFGTRSLYRTDNAAGSWERIYRTPSDREVISSIGLTPSDPQYRVRGSPQRKGHRHPRRRGHLADFRHGTPRSVHRRCGRTSGRSGAGLCGGRGIPDRACLPHGGRGPHLGGPHREPAGPPGQRDPLRSGRPGRRLHRHGSRCVPFGHRRRDLGPSGRGSADGRRVRSGGGTRDQPAGGGHPRARHVRDPDRRAAVGACASRGDRGHDCRFRHHAGGDDDHSPHRQGRPREFLGGRDGGAVAHPGRARRTGAGGASSTSSRARDSSPGTTRRASK